MYNINVTLILIIMEFNIKIICQNIIDLKSDKPTYAIINTSDYFEDSGRSSIIITDDEHLYVYGVGDLSHLKVGERWVSEDYGESAQVVRLS